MKLRKKHIKRDVKKWHIGAAVAVIVVIAICVACFVFFFKSTCADITEIDVNQKFHCTITRDELVFDEEAQCDNFVIYMTFKNNEDPKSAIKDRDDLPTSDEVSPEEESKMSQEEKDAINQKSIEVFKEKVAKRKSPLRNCNFMASQDGMQLIDAVCDRPSGNTSNETELDRNVDAGQSLDVVLIYQLRSHNDVKMLFNPIQLTNEDGSLRDLPGNTEVTFRLNHRSSDGYKAVFGDEQQQIREKQEATKASLPAVDVYLVDGWYAEVDDGTGIRLKNQKFEDAKIQITYSSNETARQQFDYYTSAASPKPDAEMQTFGNNSFIKYQPKDSSIYFFADCPNKMSIMVQLTNVQPNDVTNFLKSLVLL